MSIAETASVSAEPQDVLRVTASKCHLMLPPDWRWQQITQKKRVYKERDDPFVVAGHGFFKAASHCADLNDYDRLRKRYPGIYEAWDWYHDPLQQDRWSIESYLCSDASLAHIAERSGEAIESVYAYSQLFFDIVGKQKHRGYMLNRVLGASARAGLSGRSYDFLLKLFGMLKGPLFLDRILYNERAPSRMTSYDQGDAMAREIFEVSMSSAAIFAAASIRPDSSHNVEVIFSAYNKMVEIERSTDDPEVGQTLIIKNISKMINGFGFTVAEKKPEIIDVHFEVSGRELRASEMIDRAMGRQSPRKEVHLLQKFPDEAKPEPKKPTE